MSFEAPSQSSIGPKPADLHGHLLIIKPTEYKSGIVTSLGDAEAIQCDVIDLDSNEEHSDVLFFNVGLRSGLKSKIGSQVLTRIGQGTAKPGKSAPWILVDATTDPADVAKATAYITAKATGTLAAPATPQATVTPEAIASVVDINDPAIQALLAKVQAKA
jgi:hypothetical protein